MEFISSSRPDLVLMAHNSPAYARLADKARPVVSDGNGQLVADGGAVDELWAEGVAKTIARFDELGIPLASIDAVPTFTDELAAPTFLAPNPPGLEMRIAEMSAQRGTTVAAERELLDTTIDLADVLCPAGTCRTTNASGEWLYFDPSHLNRAGSLSLTSYLEDEIERVLAGTP